MPQNLASRCERGTGPESRTGRGGGKEARGAARDPGGRTRPRTTNFTHTSQTQERAEKRPGNWGEGGNLSNGGRRTESGEPSAAWHERGRRGLSGQEPQSRASAQGPPDVPRGSHLAAPRPTAGGWLVPGLSSSSSSLSREGLRGAKNRERLCQGAPPLLRPPDISPARLPVRGRLRGARKAVSCVRSPAQAGPTRRGPPARFSPSRAGEARARRATRAAAFTVARWHLLPPPPARPKEEPEAAAPPPPPSAGLAGSPPETRSGESAARDPTQGYAPKRVQGAA